MAMATAMAMATVGTLTDKGRPQVEFEVERRRSMDMKPLRILRWGMVPVAVALAAMAGRFSLLQVNSLAGVRGYQFAPMQNSRGMSKRATILLSRPASTTNLREIRALSVAALELSPLDSGALAALGYLAELGTTREMQVRSLMNLSERISRREPLTVLWLIEWYVARNDIAAVLQRYDMALTVKPSLANVLFPILANSLEDKAIRAEFAQTLVRKRPWQNAAIKYALANGKAAEIAEVLLEHGPLSDGPETASIEAEIFAKLVNSGRIDLAAKLYRRLPGGDPSVLSSLAINARSTAEGRQPVTWAVATTDRFESTIIRDDSLAAMAIAVSTSALTKNEVARKLVIVGPGTYNLSSKIRLNGASDVRVTLRLDCAGAGRGRNPREVLLPPGKFSQAIDFGMPCGAYVAGLYVDGGQGQYSSDVVVESLGLSRAQ